MAGILRLCHDLAHATSLEDMFDHVVDALVTATGLRRASVLTLDEGGVMRFRAWRGLSPSYRAAVDGHSPWTSDARDPEAILVDDVTAHPATKDHVPVFAAEGIRALVFLPLCAGGRLLGKFMLYAEAPQDWRASDLGFARAAADLLASLLLREQVQARLQKARRMESLGVLAGGIAHDFNNLLTSILGFVDLIRHETLRGTPARTHADELLKAVEHAGELTQDLLGFARPQPMATEPVDLVALVAEARPMLQRTSGERCPVVIECSAPTAVVRANRAQLQRVLVNLVQNARDASPAGGRITIHVRVGAAKATFDLEVADRGIGMDEATRRRVFEPLFTTKPHRHGTGLGLATCHGIVTALGGDIAVQSSPGRGSRFTITLPGVGEAPGALPGDVDGAHAATAGEVLVVEDQEQVASVLEHTLKAAGYRVWTAADGLQALDVLRRHEVDLVVSDVVMPNLDGLGLLAELRRSWPLLPVLLMTGYVDGTNDLPPEQPLLLKPFLPRELTKRVHALLHRATGATDAEGEAGAAG